MRTTPAIGAAVITAIAGAADAQPYDITVTATVGTDDVLPDDPSAMPAPFNTVALGSTFELTYRVDASAADTNPDPDFGTWFAGATMIAGTIDSVPFSITIGDVTTNALETAPASGVFDNVYSLVAESADFLRLEMLLEGTAPTPFAGLGGASMPVALDLAAFDVALLNFTDANDFTFTAGIYADITSITAELVPAPAAGVLLIPAAWCGIRRRR